MCSERFPFIVGVWVWSRIRIVLVVLSSPRRRVVVGASLISLYWAAHTHCDWILAFKIWKVKDVSHKMLVLARLSHKMGGRCRVLRDRRDTLDACQYKCVVVSRQAQHFVMWPFAMSWQAKHCVAQKVLFRRIAVVGMCKSITFSNIVAGAAFRKYLEKWCKLRKSHILSAL